MNNIGPVAVFILYMALAAWAKKKKAQGRAVQQEAQSTTPPEPRTPEPPLGGLFEQLKREFGDVQKPPEVIRPQPVLTNPEPEPVDEQTAPAMATVALASSFAEGDDSMPERSTQWQEVQDWGREGVQESIDSILEPYSKLKQGILLREVLGKPRALQDNKDWFYFG